MQLLSDFSSIPKTLALFPGSFHPVTVAHIAVAQAALSHVEEVWFTLPRSFPHKYYDRVTLNDRVELLEAALDNPRLKVAVSEGGLFIEMARECRRRFPQIDRLYLLCGRDAAERIVNWDYDGIEPIEAQLKEFELLIAARRGEFAPPQHLSDRVQLLPLEGSFDEISASQLRDCIRSGGRWEHLTPATIREKVRELYSAG